MTEPTEEELTAVVLNGLSAQQRGEPIDEDAMAEAGTILLGILLVANGGIPVDDVLAMFDRQYELHFEWDPAVGLTVKADFESGDYEMSATRTVEDVCPVCSRVATGYALIGDQRYCHGDDDPTPTCYMRAQWAGVGSNR